MSGELTAAKRVELRETYNTWMKWSVQAGTAGFLAATLLWMLLGAEPVLFAGLGLYWLGCAGMAYCQWQTPVPLNDERDVQIRRMASLKTMSFVLFVTIVALPAAVTLDATGLYTVSGALSGAIWGYLLLILVFVGTNTAMQRTQ